MEIGCWVQFVEGSATNDLKVFWEPSNLWRFCVHVDGKYTALLCALERYRAMELMYERGLEEPANDLARPIAEAAFRLDYLLDDEDQLVDYARWQLHDCYHRVLKPISQFEGIDAELKQNCDDGMSEIKAILGGRFSEKPLRPTWKNVDRMITFESQVEDQERKRRDLYMQTGNDAFAGIAQRVVVPSSFGLWVFCRQNVVFDGDGPYREDLPE